MFKYVLFRREEDLYLEDEVYSKAQYTKEQFSEFVKKAEKELISEMEEKGINFDISIFDPGEIASVLLKKGFFDIEPGLEIKESEIEINLNI